MSKIVLKFSVMNNFKQFLHSQSQRFLSIYLGLAGFSTYFCMYAFRKPFTAGDFQDVTLWGTDYKIILVIATHHSRYSKCSLATDSTIECRSTAARR